MCASDECRARNHNDFEFGSARVYATKTRFLPSGEGVGGPESPRKLKYVLSGAATWNSATDGAAPRRSEPSQNATAIIATTAIAAAIQPVIRPVGGAIVALPAPSASHCNWRPTSAALCQRSSGSFAKQVRIAKSRAGGVIGRNEEIGFGWA